MKLSKVVFWVSTAVSLLVLGGLMFPIYLMSHHFDLLSWPTSQLKTHCSAVVRTRGHNPIKKFLGANGAITIYKPSVQISQSSSVRIKLINGGDSIEAGWMVNPRLFNDSESHLYVGFTAGANGCINTQCPGFVQVATKYPLGLAARRLSVVGGVKYSWNVSIDKLEDGNWWLSLTSDKVAVGYWPRTLFTTLADNANQVEWGGEVRNPESSSPLPRMGNGAKARYDTHLSAFFSKVSYLDGNFQKVTDPQDTEKSMNCDRYTVLDASYQGDLLGRLIFFGGY